MPILDLPDLTGVPDGLPGLGPRLENGDRLGRADFMRLYEALPDVTAELIQGIVYIRGPVWHIPHGKSYGLISTWIGTYAMQHPTLQVSSGGTVVLDEENVVQPDVLLFRPNDSRDGVHVGDDDYVHGPPDLVCEVAATVASIDAHAKAEAYHAAGVREYLLWRAEERRVDLFERAERRFRRIETDADGIVESRVFPCLRSDVPALLRDDVPIVLRHVRDG